MASEVQPISYLSLAASTTLNPRDRATIDTDVEVPEALRDERPLPPSTVITPNAAVLERAFGVPHDVVPPPPSPERASGNRLLRTRLFILDLFAVSVFWVFLGFEMIHARTLPGRFGPGVAAGVIMLIAMRGTGLYRSRLCLRRTHEFGRIIVASLWAAAGFVVIQWQVTSPGIQVLICGGSCVIAITLFRWQFGRWLRARRAQGEYLRGVVLVGSNDDAVLLRTMLRSEPELGYSVTAVIGDSLDDPAWEDLPHSASVTSIPQLAASTGASGILIVPYALSSATTQRAITVAASHNLHVQVWPGFGVGSRRLRNVPVSGEAFFYVEPRWSPPWQLAVKRALDVAVAGTVLALTAPIIAVAALLIKLEDRGPVFHRGERVGMNGDLFGAFKLRSMTPNDGQTPAELAALNERTDGPLFKATNDPRVTKIGRFLRASSIDELPQLWNVVRGTMSLVGPRPALPSEAAQFDEELQRRHSVRPGMTGLWQVEARHNPSFNAYRRLDLRYVDNWTLYLDISIMLATVPSVASQAVQSLRKSRRS